MTGKDSFHELLVAIGSLTETTKVTMFDARSLGTSFRLVAADPTCCYAAMVVTADGCRYDGEPCDDEKMLKIAAMLADLSVQL